MGDGVGAGVDGEDVLFCIEMLAGERFFFFYLEGKYMFKALLRTYVSGDTDSALRGERIGGSRHVGHGVDLVAA